MSENVQQASVGTVNGDQTPEYHQTTTTVRSYLSETPGHWEVSLKSSTDGVPTVVLQTAVGVLKHTVRVEPRQAASGETVFAVDETHSATPEYTPIGTYRVLQNALREARDRLAYLESDDY